jgi:hypothetical protein
MSPFEKRNKNYSAVLAKDLLGSIFNLRLDYFQIVLDKSFRKMCCVFRQQYFQNWTTSIVLNRLPGGRSKTDYYKGKCVSSMSVFEKNRKILNEFFAKVQIVDLLYGMEYFSFSLSNRPKRSNWNQFEKSAQ